MMTFSKYKWQETLLRHFNLIQKLVLECWTWCYRHFGTLWHRAKNWLTSCSNKKAKYDDVTQKYAYPAYILESMWSEALGKHLIKCYKFAHFIPTLLTLRILARMHPSYAMWHTVIISELVGIGMIEIYMQVWPNGLNIELLCRGTEAQSRYRARNSGFFSFF